MKKRFLIAALILSATLPGMGQGVMDALNNISAQSKGTARYTAMGGAFGALGGDLTSIRQNPAGIGVYRSSEISLTAGFNIYENYVNTSSHSSRNSDFYFTGDNMGVVGVINYKQGALRNLNFGFAYNNIASFNNSYRADWSNISTSLTELIASKTHNPASDLTIGSSHNPYNNMPWLPTLGYNTNLIYPSQQNAKTYNSIFNPMHSYGSANLINITSGSIDEYDFNVSGNINDMLYWGLSLNLTSIDYHLESHYSEDLHNISVNDNSKSGVNPSTTDGRYTLSNYLLTKGCGTGVKLGVIFRPINMLRIGLAVHSPTIYQLSDVYSAAVEYEFDKVDGHRLAGSASDMDNQTDIGQIEYQFTSPWHFLGSMAFVLNKLGIVSVDYEYIAANNMFYSDVYADYSTTNSYISQQVIPVHNVRVGSEFRITPLFSARLGYAYESSPIKQDIYIGHEAPLIAEGTLCNYQVPGDAHNISCGLGYRINNFSIDAAYVYRMQDYSIFAYEGALMGTSETIMNLQNHSIKLTLGVRF